MPVNATRGVVMYQCEKGTPGRLLRDRVVFWKDLGPFGSPGLCKKK